MAVIAILILSASLVLAGACGGDKDAAVVEIVPAQSDLIANIQVSEILKDEDLEGLYAAVPTDGDDPRTINGLLDKIVEEVGVDPRLVSELVVFADIGKGDKGIGIIAKGSFDEEKLAVSMGKAQDATLATTEYKGRTIYFDQDEIAFTVLDGEKLVVTMVVDGVKSVIDVHEGDADPASGAVRDRLNSLGDRMVRLALEPPEETLRQMGAFPIGIPLKQDFLGEVKILTFALDKTG